MSLILRNIKGSPLTWTEMDANLEYLEGLANSAGEQDLSSVLSEGNETGGNDIIISSNDKIVSESTNSEIDMDNNALSLKNIGVNSNTDTINLSINMAAEGNRFKFVYENQTEGDVSELNMLKDGMLFSKNYSQVFELSERGLSLNLPVSTSIANLNLAPGLDLTTIGQAPNITTHTGNGISFSEVTGNAGTVISSRQGDNFTGISFGDFNGINGTEIICVEKTTDEIVASISVVNDPVNQEGYIEIATKDYNGTLTSSITLEGNGTVIIFGDLTLPQVVKLSPSLPTYDNNVDAISGGLVTNQLYKTSTGELRVVVV